MKKIGSQDVANLAGVSRATVSRVFTPSGYVKKETRKKVLEAAEKLGYRPNVIARSLTMRRTKLVGIVAGKLKNPFQAEIVGLLAEELQKIGLASVLVSASYDEADKVVQSLMSYQVDALVLISAIPTAHIALECERSNTPLITTNKPDSSFQHFAVYSDNEAGAKLIANHLMDEGWTRFAYIAGIEEVQSSKEREAGFTAALAQRGFALVGRENGYLDRERSAKAMAELLSQPNPPDAVFCANDDMAVAALDVARCDFGLKIGRDIAVCGYAQQYLSSLRAYDVTSIDVRSSDVVASVVSLIVKLQANEALRDLRQPIRPSLSIRSSTKRILD